MLVNATSTAGVSLPRGVDLHAQRHLGRAVDGDVHRADPGRGRARREHQLVRGAVGDLARRRPPSPAWTGRRRRARRRRCRWASAWPGRTRRAAATPRGAPRPAARCARRPGPSCSTATGRGRSGRGRSRRWRRAARPAARAARRTRPAGCASRSAARRATWRRRSLTRPGSSGSPSETPRDDGAGEGRARGAAHGGDESVRRHLREAGGRRARTWNAPAAANAPTASDARRYQPAHRRVALHDAGDVHWSQGALHRTVTGLRHAGICQGPDWHSDGRHGTSRERPSPRFERRRRRAVADRRGRDPAGVRAAARARRRGLHRRPRAHRPGRAAHGAGDDLRRGDPRHHAARAVRLPDHRAAAGRPRTGCRS